MSLLNEKILEILNDNYRKAIEAMPPDLVAEFQKKIIRPQDLKSYAKSISVAIQLDNKTAMLRIENWVADDFQRGGFARKLTASGYDPTHIYELLMKGILDYK